MLAEFWLVILKKRDHLEELDVDGRLNWFLTSGGACVVKWPWELCRR